MDETNIQLKFEMAFFNPAIFKENEVNILNNIIHGSRIGRKISFYKYCILTFNDDDKKHWFPNAELVDKYKRSKINCLCYKNKPRQNTEELNKYDYLFVYQLKYKDTNYYGIVGYNETTNTNVHVYGISYDYTCLLNNLQSMSYRKISD